MVGDVGFHGPPPVDGVAAVEIGYAVVPAWRGRGVATQACRSILSYAWAHGAAEVWADAEPANAASRAVLGKNGFRPGPDGAFWIQRPDGS